jgi:outer membrane protein OmpA-like peptidoglycan-associated protein
VRSVGNLSLIVGVAGLGGLVASSAVALPLPVGPQGRGPVMVQEAAPAGRSVDELREAIESIKRRLAEQRAGLPTPPPGAALAEELAASARRIEELSAAVLALREERDAAQAAEELVSRRLADLSSELEQERATRVAAEQQRDAAGASAADLGRQVAALERDLAERDKELAAARDELASLRRAADELRASNAQLEAGIAEVRATAERQARERAAAAAAEVDAARQRAQRLDAEVQALRDIAASSVKEVESLGEQLLAALADSQALLAAAGELRVAREGPQVTEVAPVGEPSAAPSPEPAAGPPAALALSDFSDAGDGWMMTIPAGLDFVAGSDRLTDTALASLAELAELIRGLGNPAVRIVGHTDSEGDAEFNRVLSQRRAQAVRTYLVERGSLEPRLITAEGYGEDRPIANNATRAGRQQNRRVEIFVKP